jgi:hypothetical protein
MHEHRGLMAMMLGASLLFAPGCDDGDDSSGDENAGDTGGDGDGDPGDGDGDDKDPSTGDGDGDDGNADFGSESGELMGCAVNEIAADCTAEPGCSPVYGKPLVDDGDGGFCTVVTEEFIGCVSSLDLCPSLGKTLCEGDSYWRTSACVPDNLGVCDAPGEITGDC